MGHRIRIVERVILDRGFVVGGGGVGVQGLVLREAGGQLRIASDRVTLCT
jgi:hypothetical protein